MSVAAIIKQKLNDAFAPSVLQVKNESYMHRAPEGAESHFKVVVVSDAFIDMRLLQRHRAINHVLVEELKQDVHALAIHSYTSQEWLEQSSKAPYSPRCVG